VFCLFLSSSPDVCGNGVAAEANRVEIFRLLPFPRLWHIISLNEWMMIAVMMFTVTYSLYVWSENPSFMCNMVIGVHSKLWVHTHTHTHTHTHARARVRASWLSCTHATTHPPMHIFTHAVSVRQKLEE
jgi:hypothetical protein